jgi:hypothetical protein
MICNAMVVDDYWTQILLNEVHTPWQCTIEEGVGVGAAREWPCVLVDPSGPVSREIRLTRWCRDLIINEPNLFSQDYVV